MYSSAAAEMRSRVLRIFRRKQKKITGIGVCEQQSLRSRLRSKVEDQFKTDATVD